MYTAATDALGAAERLKVVDIAELLVLRSSQPLEVSAADAI